MTTFNYCKIRKVKSPTRGTSVAAGVDFFIPEDISDKDWSEKCKVTKCNPITMFNEQHILETIILAPGDSVMIPSGIKMKLPPGYAMVMMNKSGVGAKKQLDTLACVIDEDYEGEVHLNLVNSGKETQMIMAGDKIVQGVIIPINYAMPNEVENETVLFENSNSERKDGGFGSTGTV